MKRSSLSFLELLKKFCTQTEGRERESEDARIQRKGCCCRHTNDEVIPFVFLFSLLWPSTQLLNGALDRTNPPKQNYERS